LKPKLAAFIFAQPLSKKPFAALRYNIENKKTILERQIICCSTTKNRDDWIRTSGPFVPNEVRYQAAPHPVIKMAL
jgi:hypothetical protein